MYYVLYRDSVNFWRWTLYAANHKKIADSGESYWNKADAIAGIELTKKSGSAPTTER